MNKEPNQTVLVLDGHELSTLSIIRSLGRKNLQVTVASEHGNHKPITHYSRYTHGTFFYTDPLVEPERFAAEILAHIKNNRYDVLIPVTEKTVIPLAKHKQEIEQHTRLATPQPEIVEQTCDKANTFKLAAELNIPIPQSFTVASAADIAKLLPQLTYPVVIKPSRSVADNAGDIRIKLNVQYAFSEPELERKCQEMLPITPLLLQEYFIGDGVGVEILADQGEVVYAFQHKRLHELPLTGGGSCLRESTAVNPQLLAYSKRLIKAMAWHGVAMVEFKYNEKSTESRLMEINGRFWGSLPLAVSAGADFPYYLYQLLVTGKHPQAQPATIGVQSRKLKEDLYWFLIVLLRRETSPLIRWPTARQLWREALAAFSCRHHIDSFAWDDPKPAWADACRIGQWLSGMAYGPIQTRWHKAVFNWHKKQGAIKKALPTAKHLLFLCYGNINRSVLAEKCLTRHLGHQPHGITIRSAGFHPKPNRPADPMMVAIAKEQGIDLSNWSSNKVDEAILAAADVIFVMEIAHFHIICDKFPKYRYKIHLLGAVTDNPEQVPLEIADPYGKTVAIYQRCFHQVNAACQTLAKLLT